MLKSENRPLNIHLFSHMAQKEHTIKCHFIYNYIQNLSKLSSYLISKNLNILLKIKLTYWNVVKSKKISKMLKDDPSIKAWKMFIFQQTSQNFPPRSLKKFPSSMALFHLCISLLFQSKSQNFPSRSWTYCPLFPALLNILDMMNKNVFFDLPNGQKCNHVS